MKTFLRLAALAGSTFAFAIGISALAQHDHGGHGGGAMPMPSMPAVRSGKIKGTLVAKEQNSITVQTKGKTVTYALDSRTKYKGGLEQGVEVTVKYVEQNGLQKASSVEAKKVKRSRKG